MVNLYEEYKSYIQKIADIRYSSALLQWDQETYLPSKGATARGRQVATLSELAHELFTAEKFGQLLDRLIDQKDLSDLEMKNVVLSREDYQKQKKYSPAFVRKMAETTQRSFHSWIKARKEDDFTLFQNDLKELVELKKEETNILGFQAHPYDALLNDHDKGSSVSLLDRLFSDLRDPLKTLLDKIKQYPYINDDFLHQQFPKNKQWDFGIQVLRDMHYDFEAGRQDIAEHPFTINFNSEDVRITTRIDENDLSNMIWSCIHEGGHALYEQGIPADQYGLPLGEPASFSIHESQSRLWENHIGRSIDFCKRYLPLLKQYFPDQLNNLSVEDFYKGINKVQPSLIRTEADELTYHFHVMIRYEIEKKLIEGSIKVEEIREYWNQHYLDYLGVKVPNDKMGCLQDVHWSHGSFGYFPTYSQGSLYAAQFYAQAQKDLLKSCPEINSIDYQALLSWLRQQVHKFGRYYTSEDLCKQITGEGLNTRYFLDYLLAKYSNIYQF